MKKQKSYEESVNRLQEIITELEKTDISLEASMKLFEEGVGLIKQCEDVLKTAQQKIDTLTGTITQNHDELE